MSKQYSVQQQNALALAAIKQTAAWWRARPVPEALRQCAASHGVALDAAIMLDLQLAFPGMPAVSGKLLSADGHFIHFEMDLDEALHPLPGSVAWDDISARYDLAAHKRGTGVGYGVLCQKVLQELNRGAC
ncbi:hypothetical protein GCN74_25000 [Janthinobacterium sp. FT14W]|uniref:hypothetical protein n=1 Tax=Janthinobacterium sp. FT14W TaxID=2654253 RepID=UPI001264DA32|nr:hypothetical protein [Janthinobacterium sp. FT14W]KAB8053788.1 hypothetical protein GCN74_25000 [Janthinobacterium sp. FT14W]